MGSPTFDAEFDGEGHLLVADYYNHKVHIFNDRTGETLKVIEVGRSEPYCLTVRNCDLLLGLRNPTKLHTIKYLG